MTQGELRIARNLTIAGTNETKLTITRDISASPAARIFFVQTGGSLTLTNTVVTGGTAPQDFGGIYNEGTLTLINSEVTGNSAGGGGGIENRGTLNSINSTISNNIAFAQGDSGRGGGIESNGTMNLINTTISNNQATSNNQSFMYGGFGGGIFIQGFGSMTVLRNVTIAGNSATQGSGGGIYGNGTQISLGNTIVANNSAGSSENGPDIWEARINSEGYNLIKNTSSVTISGNTTGNILGVAPQLDPNGLRDNGGATKTIALQQNSPAVDKGKGSIAGVTSDQRGLTRPIDNPSIPNAAGGDGSDIRAFEVQGGSIISINNLSLNEGNNGTMTFGFTVSLSSSTNQTVTVNFATANGTATAPTDYQSASGQISFASGETVKQITVLVNGDQEIESNEMFTVNLSNANNATISVSNGQGTATISNDDNAGSFQFSSTNFSVNENTGGANITITRTGGNGSGASVVYATQNGTAIAGQDYTTTSGSITFGANETNKTFTIPIINDTVVEPNETVSLAIFNPTAGGTLGIPNTATLTIVDDEQTVRRTLFDFDGDGKSDVSIFHPSNGFWYTSPNPATNYGGIQFGVSTDKLVPADYDGDGKTDVAVYRGGTWYLQRSQLGFTGVAFGDANDIPVPADYDGDGKADIAVFRPSNGVWYLLQSTAGFTGIAFGVGTDTPVAADYDGDGKADLAVFRNGVWYLNRSTAGFTGVAFGAATDKPIPNSFVR